MGEGGREGRLPTESVLGIHVEYVGKVGGGGTHRLGNTPYSESLVPPIHSG